MQNEQDNLSITSQSLEAILANLDTMERQLLTMIRRMRSDITHLHDINSHTEQKNNNR